MRKLLNRYLLKPFGFALIRIVRFEVEEEPWIIGNLQEGRPDE